MYNILIIRDLGFILNTRPHQQFAVIIFYRVYINALVVVVVVVRCTRSEELILGQFLQIPSTDGAYLFQNFLF